MEIREISRNDYSLIEQCQKIAQENYLDNLVLLGDLHPPCIDLTDIFGLFSEDGILLTFFVIFTGFSIPSVVLPVKLKEDHYNKIMEFLQKILPEEFFFLSLELLEENIEEFFEVNWISTDYCMIRDSNKAIEKIPSSCLIKAEENNIAEIDIFYKTHTSSPWHPKQFESGFYFFIRKDKRIIACGGTHFETPKLAQLGNIFVLENYRGQHYGEILTSGITAEILLKKELATLFVHNDNHIALSLYQKLGFEIYKEANLIFCKKR